MDLKNKPSEARKISKSIANHLEKNTTQTKVDLVGLTKELTKRRRDSFEDEE